MADTAQKSIRVPAQFDEPGSPLTVAVGALGLTAVAKYTVTNLGRIPVVVRMQTNGAGGVWTTLPPGESGTFQADGADGNAVTLDAYRKSAPMFISTKTNFTNEPQHIGVLQVIANG